MPIHAELLEILACPETKQGLTLASPTLLHTLNTRIQQGTLYNRQGTLVTEPLGSGLVREDQRYLYPIRDDIPIMLVDEAIPLETGE